MPTVSKGYKFNAEQIEWFNAYEAVRKEGRFNMFDPNARMFSGLSKDEYRFVMSNYIQLKESIK